MTAAGAAGAGKAEEAPSRLVWSIALPAMATNVATALFGLADMWAIGRLGDAPAQGAVELGAKFMMGLLTVFNFLRTGTIALTAQGIGRGDEADQARTLARAMAVALGIGVLLLLAMQWTIPAGLDLLNGKGAVRESAGAYIALRYWAGPFWLANCVLVGTLIGQRRVRAVLAIEVTANLVHITLDLTLVLVAHWGVEGVAAATVMSEGFKTLLLTSLVLRGGLLRRALAAALARTTWHRTEIARLFALNRDLFARTLLLNGAFLVFARFGAQQGAEVLAANGILFQLFMLSALILDGFESSSQVLCGEALGARRRAAFGRYVRASLTGAGIAAVGIALAYATIGGTLADSFSTDPGVVATVGLFSIWAIAMPLAGFASFVLDGVFVGAGWTRAMLGTMAVALAIYLALLWLLAPLGNHGLWSAFTAFFVARAAGQFAMLPRLMRRSFSAS